MDIVVKFDLRSPAALGASPEASYPACVEISAWADRQGFASVRLNEHHGSDDDYLSAPPMMAAAVASRTKRIQLRMSVLVLPLYDPIMLAEQLAVLDQISSGRTVPVFAGGYVPREFAMFGKDIRRRGRLVEEGVAAIRRCWRGESFEFNGRPVRVRPLPYKGREIPLMLGGNSTAAALRAARIADGFEPGIDNLIPPYLEERKRLGKAPGWTPGRRTGLRLLWVSEDPEKTWREIGPHLVHETNAYSALATESNAKVPFDPAKGWEELRAGGNYKVVTPEEYVAIAKGLGACGQLELHPLVGGVKPELGMTMLELFASKVAPALS